MAAKKYSPPRINIAAVVNYRDNLMSVEELAEVLTYLHKTTPRRYLPNGGWTAARVKDIEENPEGQPLFVLLHYLSALDTTLMAVPTHRLPPKPIVLSKLEAPTHRILKEGEPDPN